MRENCFGLLYDNLDKDSRAKRAFAILSDIFEFSAVTRGAKPGLYNYPIQVCSGSGLTSAFRFLWQGFRWILRNKPQVVYAEGLAPLVPAGLASFFTSFALIYDGRELYLKDERGESSYQWYHRVVEAIFIRRCQYVLAANEERAEFVTKHYGLRRPVQVLRNIPAQMDPQENLLSTFEYLNSERKFLVYQGWLSASRGVEKIVQSIPYWPKEWDLVLVAEGRSLVELRDLAKRLGVEGRLKVHSFVPHQQLAAILSRCHLGLISYDLKGPNNEYCAPNKLYEYAQTQLPMLTTPQKSLREVFNRYRIGATIARNHWESDDFRGIAADIVQAMETSFDPQEFSRFNRDFNWEMESKNLKSMLKERALT